MAATIGFINVPDLDYAAIDSTTATVSASTSGWAASDRTVSGSLDNIVSDTETTGHATTTTTVWKISKYEWKINGSTVATNTTTASSNSISGKQVSNLKAGDSNRLTVYVYCYEKSESYPQTQNWKRDKKEDGTFTSWTKDGTVKTGSITQGSERLIGNDHDEKTIYTKPSGIFSDWDGVQTGRAVSDYITATSWNNWIKRCLTLIRWRRQQLNTQDIINSMAEVKSEWEITAIGYNQLATAANNYLGASLDNNKQSGEIIYASYFTSLSNAVNI